MPRGATALRVKMPAHVTGTSEVPVTSRRFDEKITALPLGHASSIDVSLARWFYSNCNRGVTIVLAPSRRCSAAAAPDRRQAQEEAKDVPVPVVVYFEHVYLV